MILLVPFLVAALLALLVVAAVVAVAVWALCAAAARADRELARRQEGERVITVRRLRRRSPGQ